MNWEMTLPCSLKPLNPKQKLRRDVLPARLKDGEACGSIWAFPKIGDPNIVP